MRSFLTKIVPSLLLVGVLSGCALKTKTTGEGSWTLFHESSIGVRTRQVSPEPAEVETLVTVPLLDSLLDGDDDENSSD